MLEDADVSSRPSSDGRPGEGPLKPPAARAAPGADDWYPPSPTVPLPVEIVSGAAAVGHEGWFPPSRTHPLPVEVIAGAGPGGGIPDAPDAQLYGRRGPPAATWDLVTTGTGVPEAPLDGTSNLRRNGGWTNIIDGGTY